MYVNITVDPLWDFIPQAKFSYDRSPNKDFIFDLVKYRVRINFSLTDWSQWYYDNDF